MTTSDPGKPSGFMAIFDRTMSRFEFAALVASCTSLFATMLLVFLDAVLRYTFNSPLKFTSDLVTLYLISASLLLVLSDTLRRGGHICVDLFARMLPLRIYHLLMGVALICSVAVIGLMAKETTLLSWESWHNNELMVGIYAWSLWYSKAIVAVGLILLALRLLHLGLSQLIAGMTGNLAAAVSVTHDDSQPIEDTV
jgi:TRAP-type C4-dicarboxylate transport system permease small subunit